MKNRKAFNAKIDEYFSQLRNSNNRQIIWGEMLDRFVDYNLERDEYSVQIRAVLKYLKNWAKYEAIIHPHMHIYRHKTEIEMWNNENIKKLWYLPHRNYNYSGFRYQFEDPDDLLIFKLRWS